MKINNELIQFKSDKIQKDYTFCLLADIHNTKYSSLRLYINTIKKIEKQNPDAILIAGDFIYSADNDNVIKFNEENKAGISNLISILSVLSNKDITTIEKEYKSANYGQFKTAVANVVCDFIKDLQVKYNSFRNSDELENILNNGAKNARIIAKEKLINVRNKMGIYH